jgi:3-phosphoshikimate 1-carboxyvinyltransferase
VTAQRVDTLAVIGLGLIGGSLALALREAGEVRRVLGYDQNPEAVARALALGVIDAPLVDARSAVQLADLVVLAVPTVAAAALMVELAGARGAGDTGAVLSDVASVKGNIEQALCAAFGAVPPYVVLGHPIAGSERSGVSAARADLFRAHRCILTPAPAVDPAALAQVQAMWQAAGTEVSCMSVAEHDRVLAATSHLPHVLAYCLVDTLARSQASEAIFRYAAGGFRDFTRIASSDPLMWRDVALGNRNALLAAVDEFECQLQRLRSAIAEGDAAALLHTFATAKAARDAFAETAPVHDAP